MSARTSLAALLDGIVDAAALADASVGGLCLDSRAVEAGDAFVALRGLNHHGIEFAAAARRRGAAVVLAEAPAPSPCSDPGPTVWIEGLSQQLGRIAARFYASPAAAMPVTGVTGTNGKTTVVQLLASAWQLLGKASASVGTLGSGVTGQLRAAVRTTPDAIRTQALLADFRDRGIERVAMEVSSHALVQGRVNGVPFTHAVFTNLSRDHLDYHADMDAYFAAKARLFAWPTLTTAVINVDDPRGRELAARLDPGVRCLGYGLQSTDAELRADGLDGHADGFDFNVHTPWGRSRVHTRLLGRINVANLLAVVACLGAEGVAFTDICAVLPKLQPVRGRMQTAPRARSAQPTVVIDYAHTPDALTAALASLRPHTRGRLLCVFGAGGERDRGKRPLMGRAAEIGADGIIITDDNPRGEDGDAIVAEINAGLEHANRARVIRDRRRAIAAAIAEAAEGDVVLIAGKGHETTQDDASGAHPFDDLAVATELLTGPSSQRLRGAP